MARSKTPESGASVHDVSFKTALEERYLAYALSTIMARSLPDVRDGLKPVHRRLLYAMLQLKLDPKSGFKKCARVVGDVIGKYHPHGDSSVYDALVRLAQGFAVRYPLVDGQGNFGSIDGDNAAAMRYTEARLTEFAIALMEGLNENSIDFRATYDGEDMEPIVLPAAVPNLLANGSEGIAVGMATSIPPHNVGELADALLYIIQHPDCSVRQLVRYVKGPDFPTGGILVEPRDNIVAAYETGRGSFRMRAVWKKESLSHGLYQIIVTEIPYQVEKSKLIEKIADLFKEKKLPLLGNIRDESAEEMRLVLEPKSRTVDPEMLMASLFKVSDLEKRFTLNMNVLSGAGVPQVMNLKEVLEAFLAHRHEVCLRRANYRLEKIADRLEVLEGFLIVYLNIDEVIKIIRKEEDPKAKMMKKWNLTDRQAEAILNMRLRSLRKLEEIEIKQEHDALSKEQKTLNALLKSKDKQWEFIAGEITDIKERFGQKTKLGKRRTDFGEAPAADIISIEAFVEKEPVTVLLSQMGWIRAVKGHDDTAAEALKYKEGDGPRFTFKAQTTDQLLVFATDGKCYTIACDKIPRGKGQGEPIRLLIDLAAEDEIVGMDVVQAESKRQFLVASDIGKGFIVEESDIVAQTRTGKQVLNVPAGSKAMIFMPVTGDHVAVVGESRKLLVFPLTQIPVMKRGQGVALQKYKDSKLSDVTLFTLKDGLTWRTGRGESTEKNLKEWLGNRAGAGKLPPAGFPRSAKFT